MKVLISIQRLFFIGLLYFKCFISGFFSIVQIAYIYAYNIFPFPISFPHSIRLRYALISFMNTELV